MVMYRDFATRSARGLGLAGEVWNEKDGSVRVIAEGEEEKLRELEQRLREGSLLSRVDSVESEWGEPRGVYKTFSIRYT